MKIFPFLPASKRGSDEAGFLPDTSPKSATIKDKSSSSPPTSPVSASLVSSGGPRAMAFDSLLEQEPNLPRGRSTDPEKVKAKTAPRLGRESSMSFGSVKNMIGTSISLKIKRNRHIVARLDLYFTAILSISDMLCDIVMVRIDLVWRTKISSSFETLFAIVNITDTALLDF